MLAGYLLALGQINEAAEAATESLQDIRSVGGRPNYVVCTLEHLTLVAAERGQFEQATRLLGYLEAWYAANPGFFREGPEQASYERTLALLAASSPESERARLIAEGTAWTEEQAAEQALDV